MSQYLRDDDMKLFPCPRLPGNYYIVEMPKVKKWVCVDMDKYKFDYDLRMHLKNLLETNSSELQDMCKGDNEGEK